MKGKSHFLTRMPSDSKEKMAIKNQEEKKGSDTKVRRLIKEIDEIKYKIQQL